MIRIISTVLLVFYTVLAIGQITIGVTSEKDTVSFGEKVSLHYEINVPQGMEVTALDFSSINECVNFVYSVSPEELDSLMQVNIVNGGIFKISNDDLIVTKEKAKGTIPLSGTIDIEVTSIGVMLLPKPIVKHLSGETQPDFNGPNLFVKPIGNLEDLNPDQGIIEEEIKWTDYLNYIYAFLGFIVFLIALYFVVTYLKKGKEEVEEKTVEIILPADIVAIRDLNLLKEKELWQNGDAKGYHTELTRIMRQYIENRYGVQALEMTSSQLKRELYQKSIDPQIVGRFDDILQIADKVKFAKGSTGPELNIRFLEEAYNIVAETKEVKQEKEEEK